ncbi:protein HEXIM1 [Pararge aegeria]|uniref:Jg20598 protein n=2 Tax=Pararge aegeria TaxID=116150 RepID=A0A8S4RXP6_9NEOP|nr:protein HEXIM1 [Pararge aegeria]CAH2242036.1 jg20598 [Pararge aegeria aegeria]
MDVNKLAEIKDGDSNRSLILVEAPSIMEMPKHKLDRSVSVKKKRRRGKSKWKIAKPFLKVPWQDRRKLVNTKRNNRFRKLALSKTQAPFNNNQFLMEIHKPEPENNLYLFRTPSARTRDSSFSVDSEENYFYSLPEDEEEYLTKEFSSVYEDAQCERLSNMSKNELIQEYLLLEAKYDNLVKRNERCKLKELEDIKDITATDKDMCLAADADGMATDQDTSGTSVNSGSIDETSLDDAMQQLLEQEQQIRELKMANEKLLLENSHLRRNQGSSEDSESDSSSSSDSCSSSSCSSLKVEPAAENGISEVPSENHVQENGERNANSPKIEEPVVNGFHSPSE